jgi:MurNAc alpha-1-phosphate uridylyltransferase
LVTNPPYHPEGDFGLDDQGFGLADDPSPDGQRWTYANVALCRADLFSGIVPGSEAALGPLLYAGMRQRRITAEVFAGTWANVGTPRDLRALNAAGGVP